MASFVEETLELQGGRRQIVFRAGDGPPLVWLHAGGGFAPDDPFLDALLEQHSVVAPLAPGFADLADLAELRDVHELALHYDDVLEALGLDSASVIGHSFGGMIGAELAAHCPRRVSRLVLIAPVGLWNDEYPVADLFATLPTELPGLLFGDLSHPAAQAFQVNAETGELPDVEVLVAITQGMTTLAKFLWPIPDRGLARRLHRIKAPTLVVFGERDALVPARYADDFVAGIPDAAKLVVSGAGHMVPVERPDEVAEAVGRFLGVGAAA